MTSYAQPPGISLVQNLTIDCCSGFETTELDEKEIFFWDYLYDSINILFDKEMSNIVFGKKDECLTQNLMDVHHLLLFLKLIYFERLEDANNSSTGLDQGNLYYIEKYCLNTVRDRFTCKGFSIAAILKVFQLFDLVEDEESNDGVDYMQIEGSTDPINRVF